MGGRDGTFATEEGFSYDRMICENPLLAEGGGRGVWTLKAEHKNNNKKSNTYRKA